MTILLKRTTHYMTLQGGTNVNLANYLGSYGTPTNRKVQITLPVGSIIGGTVNGGYALNTGDLSSYDEVVLILKGELQGKGGTAGYTYGGHGLYIDTNSTNLSIILESTGAIRGGGGAGGGGGMGGYGDTVGSWSGDEFYEYFGDVHYAWQLSSSYTHRWARAAVGTGSSSNTYSVYGSYVYQKRAYAWGNFHFIRRALRYYGTPGSGGYGGNGRGYTQDYATGAYGGGGTYRAGSGGRGGTGGEWGENGNSGSTGYTGYKYTNTSSASGTAGSSGGSGGTAGNAIVDGTAGNAVSGAMVNNGGTINGNIT